MEALLTFFIPKILSSLIKWLLLLKLYVVRDTRIFNDPANVKVIISWGKLISFQKLENIICAYQYYYPKFSQVLKTGNNVWRFFASDVLPSWIRYQFAFWKKKEKSTEICKITNWWFHCLPKQDFRSSCSFPEKILLPSSKITFQEKKTDLIFENCQVLLVFGKKS